MRSHAVEMPGPRHPRPTLRALRRFPPLKAGHRPLLLACALILLAFAFPPQSQASPGAEGSALSPGRVFLAAYFPWFDENTWAAGITADLPTIRYNSDDPATIARHLQQAQQAGLTGFVSFWLAPRNRTDRNFAQLLASSQGTNFRSTIGVLNHLLPGQTQEEVVAALQYIRDTYSNHPNFRRHEGRPILFFTDMPRVPLQAGQSPLAAWQRIRDRVDPQRHMAWIAEGLDPSYLAVFDGLYVLKISHRAFPNDYVKLPRWGQQARATARALGTPKLWIATVSPGWNDLPAGDGPSLRQASDPFTRDRERGSYYRRTFEAAMESQPDWLFLASFNEWVEGTQIEPSITYGDTYLHLTRRFAGEFRGIAPTGLDYDIPQGHFFSQANGLPLDTDNTRGYSVTNEGGIRFWDEFQRLGGVPRLGYPASRRFLWDGFVVQIMQKGVLQWRPERGEAFLLNVFDLLHDHGFDPWLQAFRSTPPPFDTTPDQGLPWQEVLQRHWALLDANPAIRARYWADDDPLLHYGLPMGYADFGDVFVLRAQRATFQQWRVDVPWARAGDVVIANGGDLGKEAGLFPPEVLAPERIDLP